MKILAEGGVDRNGNGVIDTSTGPGDVKLWWEDERVVLSVPVGGVNGTPRAIAIDKNGCVWVGLYNEKKYVVLEPTAGLEIAQVPTMSSPYGAVIDKSQVLWSAAVGWGLEAVDTVGRVSMFTKQYGAGYGIVADGNGIVWLGAYPAEGVWRYDPLTNLAVHCPSAGFTAGRGVCVAANGNIWVALGYGSPDNKVAKYDSAGNLLATYTVGRTPCGVGTDYDGNILIVCQGSSEVYKLKESDGSLVWKVPVGAAPYTYSDFTGFIARNITQKTGTWTVVFDSGCPGTPWGTASWNCLEPEDSSVAVHVRCADDVASLPLQPWIAVSNGIPFGPILGRFVEIKARLSTTSEVSPVLYDLTIKTANRPPDCTNAYPSVSRLWPPNHKMVPISILGVTDPDEDPVTITITRITQDEPVNGIADGDTAPDGAGIGTAAALVRAERAGSKKVPGNGRVYEISFNASDGKGGVCEGSVRLCVPHDERPGGACVDDGQRYNSTEP